MHESVQKLLRERYYLPNENTWEDIAKKVSNIYLPIYEYLLNKDFIASSPTLMNYCLNNERLGTLSSCFILKIEDSIEGIYEAIKEGAIVTKYGGGCGWDFSVIRGSGENIKTLSSNSSGPIPFVESFNQMLDSIRQGGKRRGAGMGMLGVCHPAILDFINCKKDTNKINRLNISIRIPNSFYEKLEKEPDSQHFVKNVNNGVEFALEDREGIVITTKQIWDKIIELAWSVAEPGIFNSDIATERCTVTNIDPHVSSNPCSEYTGIAYQSCNLGSINLSNLVENKKFNWEKFERLISVSTRFLNNVIDVNHFPLEKIKDITLKTRPVGLGYMGLAHCLYKQEISYNSKKAIKFTEEMNIYLTLRSMKESMELAKDIALSEIGQTVTRDLCKEYVGAYEAFDYDLFMKANKRFFKHKQCRNIDIEQLKEDIKKYGVRNSCFTSIAPTGSISFIANASSGVEPVFALSYSRKIEKENREYDIVYVPDPVFDEYLTNNFDEKIKIKILKEVADSNGSCQLCEELSDEIKKVFVTAQDLTPAEHLDILEVASRYTSLSVSKTINLSSTATKEDVSNVFIDAYNRGIIGVTVYREGSREGILIHNNWEGNQAKFTEHPAPKRPLMLPCEVHRVMYKGEKWVAFVGLMDKRPFEIFCGRVDEVNLSKYIEKGCIIKMGSNHYAFSCDDEILIKNISKTFDNEEHDDFARCISQLLRHGTPIQSVCDTLNKSKGDITKFSKVLVRILKNYIIEGTVASGTCSTCNEKLIYVEGCVRCSNPTCSWTKCG